MSVSNFKEYKISTAISKNFRYNNRKWVFNALKISHTITADQSQSRLVEEAPAARIGG